MSKELILFNKRLSSLNQLLNILKEINDDSKIDELSTKLNRLESIIRNSETLNTGGHFEWVDSKIVCALKIGQYICLEHVNLCSSAILDRLNSVFETNGKLLLSEKGVSSNNQSEIISKHNEFRAFLTLDPKNGEISRAMRNRCIELNLTKDAYSIDDLKELIYENGIHKIHLIDWTLRIHLRIQQISEFNSFNVSHLCKYAFLINQNLRFGCDEKTALYDSGMEVYVRSSHIDLLGFGLDYYKNILCEEIKDELSKLPDQCVDVIDFENVIIHANNLNSLSLIRLQCEPFLISVKCLIAKMDEKQIKSVFTFLRNKYSNYDMDFGWSSTKYFLYILYEMCSLNDLDLRQEYINKRLQIENNDKLNELLNLNKVLTSTVKSCENIIQNLIPWNQHIFPRLRNYKEQSTSVSNQLKMSAMLLAQISFKDIDVDAKIKQSHINAITYSKAANANMIPNGIDKDLITYLYPFLEHIKLVTVETIRNADSITYENYSKLMCGYFWSNRLYEVSKEKLFVEKTFNQTLIDKLTLHINWMTKHFIVVLNELNFQKMLDTEEIAQYRRSLQKLNEFIDDNRHPLNEMRKQFTKKLTNFVPFFEKEQIILHEHLADYEKQTRLCTHKWQQNRSDELQQKLRILMSQESTEYKNYLLDQMDTNDFAWICEFSGEDFNNVSNEEIPLAINQISSHVNGSMNVVVDDLSEQKKQFTHFCKSIEEKTFTTDTSSFKLIISLLPIFEYFALKALNPIQFQKSRNFTLNLNYYKNIHSIDVNVLNMIQTISTEKFKISESIWNWIHENMNSKTDMKSIIDAMPDGFYRKLSSSMSYLNERVLRFTKNASVFNQHIFTGNCDENIFKTETQSSNNCVLTTSTFLSLFEENGKLRATGLGDLDIWRTTLTSLSKLIWNNIEMFQKEFSFEHSSIEQSIKYGHRILSEIRYIDAVVKESKEAKHYVEEFEQVVGYLETNIATESIESNSSSAKYANFYRSSLIDSLVAMLELHLITFMPLVDPVEKNRLKRLYVEEDQLHIKKLRSAYDFMKVIMSYENLGDELVSLLNSNDEHLTVLLKKYSKKCALRPENCVYAELVEQRNFFLHNGCRLKSQLQLITDIDQIFQRLNNDQDLTQQDIQNVTEIIKRIEWCINTAESFEQSTISRYSAYYNDFTSPLLTSISSLKHGFGGLKQCLIKTRDSIVLQCGSLRHINENDVISDVLSNLVQFPSVNGLNILVNDKNQQKSNNIIKFMDKLDNKDLFHFW